MTALHYQLKAEEARLSCLIAEKRRSVTTAPTEEFKLSRNGDRVRYYRIKDPKMVAKSL